MKSGYWSVSAGYSLVWTRTLEFLLFMKKTLKLKKKQGRKLYRYWDSSSAGGRGHTYGTEYHTHTPLTQTFLLSRSSSLFSLPLPFPSSPGSSVNLRISDRKRKKKGGWGDRSVHPREWGSVWSARWGKSHGGITCWVLRNSYTMGNFGL